MTYILVLLPVLAVGLIFSVLEPLHPGMLFSTSVPPGFAETPAGRRILRNYRGGGGAALAVLLAFSAPAAHMGRIAIAPVAVLVEVAIWMALYYVGVRQTRPFAICPPLIRTVSLAQGDSTKWLVPGVLACFIPLIATAVALHLRWSQIPASFPIHWGFDGQANGWSQRTPGSVYQPLWIGAALLVMMLVIAISTAYATGRESLRRLTRTILLLSSAFLALVFAGIALLPLLHSKTFVFFGPLTLLFVLAIVFWSRRTLLRPRSSNEPYDSTPDTCWYAGIFYFNPSDHAILVPKRFGIGYSLNFGRGASWLWLALVLLPLGFILQHRHWLFR